MDEKLGLLDQTYLTVFFYNIYFSLDLYRDEIISFDKLLILNNIYVSNIND